MGGETIWPTRPLKDCAVWYSGGTPNKATPRYWGGSIPWISAKSLNDFFVSDSEDRVTEEGARNGTRLVPKDSILFIVRGMSLKSEFRMGIATRPVTFNQDLKALVAVNDVAPAYLAYAIRSKTTEILQMVGEAGHGTGVLPTDRIQALEIPVPSLDEQHGVAAIVGALDAKIELNRKMNATLEAMARALFKSWFVDFDPVRTKAEGRAPWGMDAETAKLFPSEFVDSEHGSIPKGWAAVPVYDIATYVNGAAYKAFQPNDERRGLPIIKIAELKAGVTAQTKFSEVAMPEKYRLRTGDILFSWSGNPDTSIDTFVWAHGEAWLNQHIFRVDCRSPGDRSFVLATLKYLRPVFAEIARNKQTTGLGHVTAGDMQRLLVVKPDWQVLRAWERVASPVFAAAFHNELESTSLARIRDELLPRLLSGELPVDAAERAVEEVA